MSTKGWMALVALLLCVACSGKSTVETKRPNILFFITDDQSWLHTSRGGDPVVQTPTFDRVAKEGIYFSNAYTNCPSCAPSRASILTGRNFWELEEGGLLMGALRKKFALYTKLLEEAGYDVAYTGKGYAPANQTLDYVWKNPTGTKYDAKKKRPELNGVRLRGMSSNDYAENFKDFLAARDTSKPFCFWYGSTEPHRPYGYGNGVKTGKKLESVKVPPFFPDCEQVRNDMLDYYLEIEWADRHLGLMLEALEKEDLLDNTLVVITSDNGMPFPRAKSTAYQYGVRMPLAIRWGNKIKNPGRQIDDFVNHIDFAPTFLEAAGVVIPKEVSGKSLISIFENGKSGYTEEARSFTVSGLERHVWTRPGGVTYPRRVIHSKDGIYIHNYEPDRWPMGNPDFVASHQGYYGDIDAGPTKKYMMKHEKAIGKLFTWSFGKLPEEELYLLNDENQLTNMAEDKAQVELKTKLRRQLDAYLKETGDPRAEGQSPWDTYPFYSRKPKKP